ncbi:unnamed protein product [Boreogadus saida]
MLWSRFRLTLGLLFTHDVEVRAVPWPTLGLLFTPDVEDRAVPWPTLGLLFTPDVEDRAVPWPTLGLLFTHDVADRAVPWPTLGLCLELQQVLDIRLGFWNSGYQDQKRRPGHQSLELEVLLPKPCRVLEHSPSTESSATLSLLVLVLSTRGLDPMSCCAGLIELQASHPSLLQAVELQAIYPSLPQAVELQAIYPSQAVELQAFYPSLPQALELQAIYPSQAVALQASHPSLLQAIQLQAHHPSLLQAVEPLPQPTRPGGRGLVPGASTTSSSSPLVFVWSCLVY